MYKFRRAERNVLGTWPCGSPGWVCHSTTEHLRGCASPGISFSLSPATSKPHVLQAENAFREVCKQEEPWKTSVLGSLGILQLLMALAFGYKPTQTITSHFLPSQCVKESSLVNHTTPYTAHWMILWQVWYSGSFTIVAEDLHTLVWIVTSNNHSKANSSLLISTTHCRIN